MNDRINQSDKLITTFSLNHTSIYSYILRHHSFHSSRSSRILRSGIVNDNPQDNLLIREREFREMYFHISPWIMRNSDGIIENGGTCSKAQSMICPLSSLGRPRPTLLILRESVFSYSLRLSSIYYIRLRLDVVVVVGVRLIAISCRVFSQVS